MNCQAMQDWMARDFQGFLRDPAAQAHLDDCPDCRAVLADERLVRSVLAADVPPVAGEDLMARLRAIPHQHPRAAAAPLEPPITLDTTAAWPRRLARRVLAGLSTLWPRGSAREGRPDAAGPASAGDRRITGAARRPAPSRLAPLALAGAAAAVALAVAFLVWPRGGAPRLGQATETPTPSPVPAADDGTPAAGGTSTAPAPVGAEGSATVDGSATADAGPGADTPPPGDPSAPFANAHWDASAPAAVAAGQGAFVQDFCVLPDAELVLFILGRGKAGSREEQLAARHDLRVLQLPVDALRPNAAPVEPRVFADLGDLPGSDEAALDAIDCATTGGHVLVTRRNAWRYDHDTKWTGDLWLLDGQGTLLNTQSLLYDLDETPVAAALSPDGRAALVLGEWESDVFVLRLDTLPSPPAAASPESVGTFIDLNSPSGGAGGMMTWSPGGRYFVLVGQLAEGTDIDVFRWDGRKAERVLHAEDRVVGPATLPTTDPESLAGPVPAQRLPRLGRLDPASIKVTDEGALVWLQWRTPTDVGLPEADRANHPAELSIWSPDPSGGYPDVEGLGGFAFKVVLPEGSGGDLTLRQLLWPVAPEDFSALLVDDEGRAWHATEDKLENDSPVATVGGRAVVLPYAVARRPYLTGGHLLVFRKPDPTRGESEGPASEFQVEDWLGAVEVGVMMSAVP